MSFSGSLNVLNILFMATMVIQTFLRLQPVQGASTRCLHTGKLINVHDIFFVQVYTYNVHMYTIPAAFL